MDVLRGRLSRLEKDNGEIFKSKRCRFTIIEEKTKMAEMRMLTSVVTVQRTVTGLYLMKLDIRFHENIEHCILIYDARCTKRATF